MKLSLDLFISNLTLLSAVIGVVMVIVLASPIGKSMMPLRGAVTSAFVSADCSFCQVERREHSESPCRGRHLSLEESDARHVATARTDGGAGSTRFLRRVSSICPAKSGRALRRPVRTVSRLPSSSSQTMSETFAVSRGRFPFPLCC